MTVSDVESHAEAEGLTLLKADNKTGYFGVYPTTPCQAQALRGADEAVVKEEERSGSRPKRQRRK